MPGDFINNVKIVDQFAESFVCQGMHPEFNLQPRTPGDAWLEL